MAYEPRVRRIATEEAFAIPEQFEGYRALGRSTWSSPDVVFWHRILRNPDNPLIDPLLDVDELRLADMDANGVDVQLLLLTSPGVQVFDADTASDLAALANDRLAEAIARHPDRLAGLAAFAPQDPARAAREMERAINALGLNGFVVNSHTDGEYLDQELWAGIWGYAAETGLHGLRLITSGMNHHPPLELCLKVLGADNIMWAIDYPYQQTPECVAFLDSAPTARDDRDKIYAGNAERVFGIGAPAAATS
jgi:5-carboxyvanillate decarboxylase